MNQENENSDSSLELSFEQEQFNRLYTNQLRKKQKEQQQYTQKQKSGKLRQNNLSDNESNEMHNQEIQKQGQNQQIKQIKQQAVHKKSWDIYTIPQNLAINMQRFSKFILHLPIFKKKQEILNNIINNQVVLVTGETGCGKSTQVPRLIYQYIRQTNLPAKIICVQPRRLAVKNLHKLLTEQIPQRGAVGYHIAMQTFFNENTKILFMTNGIFLQRLVHGTQFFKQYPFIVLDEVHERDIDTDFILLSMKRILRQHPYLRVILMSATIDNKLFKYYFAEDEIDNFMTRQNFYKKFIKLQKQVEDKRQRRQQQDDGFRIERVGEQDQLYKKIQMQYLKSKYPCPTVNVTEKGKFKKTYYYLDTLHAFFQRSYCMKWGSVGFIQKSPTTNKQIFQTACILLQDILNRTPANKDRSNQSVLIFLPGLGEIQYMVSQMGVFFGKRLQNFEIIKCHSTILNDQVTKKLHMLYKDKFKVIIATNIAQSSITVFGIKYVIDFCLSKQINFNQKSRMQNLQLVWASKASCQQRAGRTGRVCDGFVFRMVQKSFYDKMLQYSTPQIQRSSLDKLILRIKLIHENQNGTIFEDPGQVLGTAIQPPNLKHIDQAIKSLILCGGLRVQNEKLILTKLGRIYVDIPLDIIYCKMLIFSMLMGTFQDTMILVCILSQNKNAFRKSAIEKHPLDYFQLMSNQQRCDFTALINAYKSKQKQYNKKYDTNKYYNTNIQLDIYYQAKLLKQDVQRRIKRRDFINKITNNENNEDYEQRFKFTIAFGFLPNLIKASTMIYDDKQQKRYRLMKKQGITVHNTIILLNSDVIRKSADQNQQSDNRLKRTWINNIGCSFRIKPQNMTFTLGHGISFLHFKQQIDLNKFLFIKFMEKKRGVSQDKINSNVVTLSNVLPRLGDVDYMQQGSITQMFKDHKVNIDNFSSNRIIGVNKQNQSYQFPVYRLLLTNSITQQSTKLSCRFTSLLPDISNLQTILHLIFYPFVTLLPDRKSTKYDSLYLKKKNKLHINYQLTDQQVQAANQIRQIVKQLMDMSLFLEDQVDFDIIEPIRVTQQGRVIQDYQQVQNTINKRNQAMTDKILGSINTRMQEQRQIKKEPTQINLKNIQRLEKMKKFWPLLKQFIIKDRKPVLQQEKWQQLYFKQKKISQNFSNIKHEKIQQKQYMNQIKTYDLRFSFFSSNFQGSISRQQRIKQYENWKMLKYKQVKALQQLVLDHDPYIICAECNLKIAKLNKIGPINGQYFRQLFQYIPQNVKCLEFNELGDYFCSMLMTIYMQKQYKVYGCTNGHILSLQFKDEKRLKIVAFSPINIIYTDGTIEQEPQFQYLEYSKWRGRFQQSKINKMKKTQENFCFVCGDKFKSVKQVQAHIKNAYHEANMRDFASTIPSLKKILPKDTNPY